MRRLRHVLLETTVGRAVLVALAVAAAWAWWAYRPAQPLREWRTTFGSVGAAALSSDGTRLLAVDVQGTPTRATAEMTLHLWDTVTGRDVLTVPGQFGFPPDVAFSADGARLVAQDAAGGLRVWDAADGRPRLTLPPLDPPPAPLQPRRTHAVSPEGRVLAATDGPGVPRAVRLWDLDSGRRALTLDGASAPLAFLADGRTVLTAAVEAKGSPPQILQWDVATGKVVGRLAGAPDPRPGALAVSPDGRRVAAGFPPAEVAADGPLPIALWDLPSGRLVATVRADAGRLRPYAWRPQLDFSPNGRFLICRTPAQAAWWDLAADPPAAHGWRDCVVFDPTGKRVVVGGPEPNAWYVYDAASLGFVARARRDGYGAHVPLVSPDGRVMAVPALGEADLLTEAAAAAMHWLGRPSTVPGPRGRAKVYRLASGREVGELADGQALIGFSADGQTLWTYSQALETAAVRFAVTIQQWPVPDGRPPAWLLGATALGVLVVAADVRRRWRRRRAVALSASGAAGYSAAQGGAPP